jgi:hypothetical protein
MSQGAYAIEHAHGRDEWTSFLHHARHCSSEANERQFPPNQVLGGPMNRTGGELYGPNFAPRSVHLVVDERPRGRMTTPAR